MFSEHVYHLRSFKFWGQVSSQQRKIRLYDVYDNMCALMFKVSVEMLKYALAIMFITEHISDTLELPKFALLVWQ